MSTFDWRAVHLQYFVAFTILPNRPGVLNLDPLVLFYTSTGFALASNMVGCAERLRDSMGSGPSSKTLIPHPHPPLSAFEPTTVLVSYHGHYLSQRSCRQVSLQAAQAATLHAITVHTVLLR